MKSRKSAFQFAHSGYVAYVVEVAVSNDKKIDVKKAWVAIDIGRQIVNPSESTNLVHGAFINGTDKPICDTGNGATSCLAGKFTILSGSGEVSAAPPPNPGTAQVGVQLIR